MPSLSSSGWTPDRIQTLRVLWREGHSIAEIGRRMRLSKNAVVGKAHRLDLPARPNPIYGRSPQRPGAPRHPNPPRRPKTTRNNPVALISSPSPAPSLPTPILFSPAIDVLAPRPSRLVSECCWPIGQPGQSGFHFCGKPSEPRKPYCEQHSGLAYVRSRDKAMNHG